MKKTDRELNALSKSLENRIMLFFMPFIIRANTRRLLDVITRPLPARNFEKISKIVRGYFKKDFKHFVFLGQGYFFHELQDIDFVDYIINALTMVYLKIAQIGINGVMPEVKEFLDEGGDIFLMEDVACIFFPPATPPEIKWNLPFYYTVLAFPILVIFDKPEDVVINIAFAKITNPKELLAVQQELICESFSEITDAVKRGKINFSSRYLRGIGQLHEVQEEMYSFLMLYRLKEMVLEKDDELDEIVCE